MFFKLNSKILFRQYDNFGYLTDNSMFGYRFLNEDKSVLNEKYISKSGAVMLGLLEKVPQNLEVIVKKLMHIFIGVEYEELKQDTFDFFMQLVNEGYLSCGESFELCNNASQTIITKDFNKKNPANNAIVQNDFLRSLHLEIANICNEKCVHCYIPHKCRNGVMPADLFYKVVKDGREMNIINVTISGGEPLLHSNFLEFLKICRELDLSVNVLTNLTLLTDEVVKEMKKNPLISIQTSIYSMDSKIHDSITQVEGSFEKTKNAVLQLTQEGIPIQISCPVMKQNSNCFYEVIDWGEAKNIPVTTDYVIFATYDHSNLNLANRLSLEEVEKAFERQLSGDYIKYLHENALEKFSATKDNPICTVCRYYLCVSSIGDVFPCVGWQTKKLGNVNETSIKKIWEESSEIRYL